MIKTSQRYSLIKSLRIGILGLSPIVGLFVTNGACISKGSSDQQSPSNEIRTQDARQTHAPSPSETTFKLVLMGNGLTADGSTNTDFTKYESSNGNTVVKTIIKFASDLQAKEAMQKVAKSAHKIVRRSEELDKERHPVGERILAIYPMEKSEKTGAILAWTNGSKYQEVSSSSLEDVVEFEKQLQRATK